MTANKAGVEVKTIQDIRRAEEQELKRQAQEAMLKQARPDKPDANRFGFSIRRSTS